MFAGHDTFDEQLRVREQVLSLVSSLDEPALVVEARMLLFFARTSLGPASEALLHLDDILAAAPDVQRAGLARLGYGLAELHGFRASALQVMGRAAEAERETLRALELIAAHDDSGGRPEDQAFGTLLSAPEARGEFARVMDWSGRVLSGPASHQMQGWCRYQRASMFLMVGDLTAAGKELDAGEALAHAAGNRMNSLPLLRVTRACWKLLEGNAVEAERLAQEALELCRQQGYRRVVVEASCCLARARIAAHGAAVAEEVTELLDATEQLLRDNQWFMRLPGLLRARAAVAAATGDDGGRLVYLQEAHRLYLDMGAPGHAEALAREEGL
jgi:tetratricopeptide (TPR) repeat protein